MEVGGPPEGRERILSPLSCRLRLSPTKRLHPVSRRRKNSIFPAAWHVTGRLDGDCGVARAGTAMRDSRQQSKGGLVSLARIEIAGSDILKIAEQRFGDYYLTQKRLFFLHQPIGDTEMQQD